MAESKYLLLTTMVLAASLASQSIAQPFTVNPERFDPYKNSKFRVKWNGRYVSGISHVSPLRRSTQVVRHRDGGDVSSEHKSPGVTSFAPIVLRRGVTHDAEFERWANKVWNFGASSGDEASLKDFRKDVSIEVLNESGQLVKRYVVFRCWPSEYLAVSELDSNANEVLVETLTLQHEGWERDYDVVEPVEKSFTEPPQ